MVVGTGSACNGENTTNINYTKLYGSKNCVLRISFAEYNTIKSARNLADNIKKVVSKYYGNTTC